MSENVQDYKDTVKNFNEKIKELQDRISNLEEAKAAFMKGIVNYALNCADSAHRDCCGAKPRELAIPETWECEKSPVGTCVYNDRKDPMHDDCLFCHDPEERK